MPGTYGTLFVVNMLKAGSMLAALVLQALTVAQGMKVGSLPLHRLVQACRHHAHSAILARVSDIMCVAWAAS